MGMGSGWLIFGGHGISILALDWVPALSNGMTDE